MIGAGTANTGARARAGAVGLLLVAGMGAGLMGCSPTSGHRPDIVGYAASPQQGVSADVTYPRIEGRKRYSFQRGSGTRMALEYVEREFELLNDGSWMVHTVEGGERQRSVLLARTAKGVSMLESIEYGRNTHTFFRDGGLLMMPTQARPEGRYGNTVIVEIFDLDNIERIRERGTATRTIEYLADESLITPAGTFMASRVRSALSMQLGSARVERINTLWVEPELGIVGDDESLVVRVFGVPLQNESRLLLLAEIPYGLRSPTGETVDPMPGWLQELSGRDGGESFESYESQAPAQTSPDPVTAPVTAPVQERRTPEPAPQPASREPIGQMTPVRDR